MTALSTETERILVEWMNTSDDPPSGSEMSLDWILRYYPYDDATAGEIFAALRIVIGVISRNTKSTRRLPLAHPIPMAREPNASIKFHGVHPPPSIQKRTEG